MLARLLAVLEGTTVTTSGFIYGLTGIIVIRAFLEVFSSPTATGFPPLEATTLIHYALFYITAYLLFTLIIGFFTKNYQKSAKIVLFGMTILWLPPLIDIVSTGGAGSTMTYLFDAPALLLTDFLTFFGPTAFSGVTTGIRVEAVFLMLGVGWYVYQSQKKIISSVCAGIFSYGAMFVLIAIPAFVYAIANVTTEVVGSNPLSFFLSLSRDVNLIANALPGTILPASAINLLEIGFNKILSLVFIPAITIFGLLLVWKLDRKVFVAHVQNIRPLRLVHYLLLIVGGALLGAGSHLGSYGVLDILALFSLLLAWTASWMVAVCVNDIYDQDIDAVSNASRPLIAGTASETHMHSAVPVFFVFSLLAGWTAGYYSFIFLLVFTACYFIYSAPPLRLKRVPGLSSLLIGFAFLSAVLAGFFLTSPDKTVLAFPQAFLFAIVICYTLGVNVRDLKDIAGDTRAGVATIPTMLAKRFGERFAFRGVGLLVVLSFMLSAFILPIPGLLIPAGIASILGYLACTRRPYKEIQVLTVHFAYFFVVALLYFFS